MPCPFCASDNPAQTQFCRACGAELPRPTASGEAPTDALPIGTLLANTYAVESVLGQGGFGITYSCHDQMLDRKVAIKEFFPAGCRRDDALVQPSRGLSESHFGEARAQFLAEARLLARCHHAGIVAVHTAFEANSTAYMVMELLHGSHLARLLETRGGRLTETEAVPLIERAGQALQFVHDQGLLHRDIKPENIIATDDGRVMLIDFGTAREYAQGQAQGHTIVVTPGYAPLEQYAKQARRGAFTDVYGLAATLYHLLTGQAPPAASDRAVGVQLRPVREENPQISEGVARAIEAGLQMEIARRPQSVREFLEWMHAPATPAVDAAAPADFGVALTPPEDASAWASQDAYFVRSSGSAHLLSTPIQARQQMVDAMFVEAPEAPPVQLAPILAPQPLISPPVTNSAPFVMAPDPSGGAVQFKNASQVEDSVKASYWVVGGMTLALGLIALFGTTARTPRQSYYSSSGYPSSGYSSSYRPSAPTFSTSAARNRAAESAGREMDTALGILPVSVEILPVSPVEVSPVAATTQSRTSAKRAAATPLVLSQGLAEFSPDGKMAAYVDMEAVVRVWSVAENRVVSSFPQSKTHPPATVRFSPDAKNLVISYQDQSERNSLDQVTVWNLATKKALGTLSVDPKKESLAARAMLRDGKVLLSKSDLKTYQRRYFLWDPRTGKQSALPMSKLTDVYSVALSADGRRLVTGNQKGQIRWWDARTGVQIAERITDLTYRDFEASPFFASNIPGNASLANPLPVEALRFSRNGAFLATSNKMQIRVFDSDAREIATRAVGYSPAFAVSPDGKFVVEGGGYQNSERNTLWNVRSSQTTRLQAPTGRIKAWSFSPDGKQIIGLSSSRTGVSLVTWRTDSQVVAPFSAPRITSLSSLNSPSRLTKSFFVSLPNRISAKQTDQQLEIRDFDGSVLRSLNVGESPLIETVFSPDRRFVSAWASQGKTQLWNLKTGQQVAQLEALNPVRDEASPSLLWFDSNRSKSVIFSSDSNLLARAGSAQGKNSIEVWDLKQAPRRIAAFSLEQPATAFAFSRDNRTLIWGDSKGKLRFGDVATRKLIAEIQNGPDSIAHLVSTQQGLVVISNDIGMRTSLASLIDVPSGENRVVFKKKGQFSISALRSNSTPWAISPDGRFVAAAGRSKWEAGSDAIDIWHLPTGTLIHTLPIDTPGDTAAPSRIAFNFRVTALAFSPDGAQLHCIDRSLQDAPPRMITWQCPPTATPGL